MIMLYIITAEKQRMSIKSHYGPSTAGNPITASLYITVNRQIWETGTFFSSCISYSKWPVEFKDLRCALFYLS